MKKKKNERKQNYWTLAHPYNLRRRQFVTHQRTNEFGEQAEFSEEVEDDEQAELSEEAEVGEQVEFSEQAEPGEQATTSEEELVDEENQRIIQNMATTDPITRAMDNLKSFQGTSQENSRDWLDRAEIVFNAYNINDVDRLTRIGIKFEDFAFDWFRDNQGPYPSWHAFRQAFERAFPPPQPTQNKHLLAEKISQRKQGIDEPVHDYFYALDQLCRQYDPQMSLLDKTIRLVGGLRDELKEKLLPLNIRTPEDFLNHAKNYESSQQVMNQQRRTNERVELLEPTYVYENNQYSTAAAMKHGHQQIFQFNHQQRSEIDSQQQRTPLYQQEYVHRQQTNVQQHPSNYRTSFNQQQPSNYRTSFNQQQPSNYRTSFNQQQPANHRTSSNQTTRNDYRNSNTNLRLCYTCWKPGHLARHCSSHLNESQGQ